MTRNDIINKIGKEYLTANIENDEFSYKKVLKRPFTSDEHNYKLDLRFEKGGCSVLIETKKSKKFTFTEKNREQLFGYTKLEREFKNKNNIVSILFNVENNSIQVWKNDQELIDEESLNDIDYYVDLFKKNKNNDRNMVLATTTELNSTLHSYSIPEDSRSQFVGSLLVALNNGLEYSSELTTKEILSRVKDILTDKIENGSENDSSENRALKIKLIVKSLDEQHIRELEKEQLINLLNTINKNLIPYIDTRQAYGEDLLNLFFTTFNKYAGKKDKNQAFTPPHITDFMCDITNLNRNSRVLDPTCGSGSFLVQAMYKMISKSGHDLTKNKMIKTDQLYGIESEEKAFGLAVTNMLIHEDGKSNIQKGSCFDLERWIKDKKINIVLMNPPFNGQKVPKDCPKNKKKNTDATKGLYFVKYVADVVGSGMLATILPLACAIGNSDDIRTFKKKMLDKHTLKAVFTLPSDIFYPGSSVSTCVMLFELGIPHSDTDKPTFFGFYKEDGFVKRKNRGRVEKINWEETKQKWLNAFRNNIEKDGFSVVHKVSYDDEWLAEAYMKTDYSKLSEQNFVQSIRDFVAYKVKGGKIHE